MMRKRVAIFGGGIAGLSAAHELVERGFEVAVFEVRDEADEDAWGGKARSINVPGEVPSGQLPLPGEHGFRFFPGFYRHLFNTMRRIPRSGGGTVYDNLVPAREFVFLQYDAPPIVIRFGESFRWIDIASRFLRWGNRAANGEYAGRAREERLTFEPGEKWFFVRRLLRYLISCERRRYEQWEYVSWWNFIGAESRSPFYKKFLAKGITQSLVAMKPQQGSTRTVAKILIQIGADILFGREETDRILNSPTNEAWITPWYEHLKERGVTFHSNRTLIDLDIKNGRVRRALVDAPGLQDPNVEADFYLIAIPVEDLREILLTYPHLQSEIPALSGIGRLKVEWMSGVQIYLNRELGLSDGHVTWADTGWAITSISQAQFWGEERMRRYGRGNVKGLLSTVISDWETRGELVDRPAKECDTEEDIFRGVLKELNAHLPSGVKEVTLDECIDYFIDPGIQWEHRGALPRLRRLQTVDEFLQVLRENIGDRAVTKSIDPLLVNTIGSWKYRPTVETGVENLFIAGDFVRTQTDLACMEAANEAARRAVNAILESARSSSPRCELFPLKEPWVFKPFRFIDRIVFALTHETREAVRSGVAQYVRR